jgi:hypothetical protein
MKAEKNRDSWCPGREPNRAEYQSEKLPLEAAYSIKQAERCRQMKKHLKFYSLKAIHARTHKPRPERSLPPH